MVEQEEGFTGSIVGNSSYGRNVLCLHHKGYDISLSFNSWQGDGCIFNPNTCEAIAIFPLSADGIRQAIEWVDDIHHFTCS